MDKVTICNMALSHIKAGPIASLSENDTNANQCQIFYDTSRGAVLEAFNWTFSRHTAALTLITEYADPVLFGFRYRYAYPTDCRKARYMPSDDYYGKFYTGYNSRMDEGGNGLNVPTTEIPARYKIELDEAGNRRTILTDKKDARLVYTKDVEDTNLFSSEFTLALSFHLAAILAYPLGQGEKDANRAKKAYDEILMSAKESDANEDDNPLPQETSEFIRARS